MHKQLSRESLTLQLPWREYARRVRTRTDTASPASCTGGGRPGGGVHGGAGSGPYCYAEASWRQGEESWIGSNVPTLEFFGGDPEVLIAHSGVERARVRERVRIPLTHGGGVGILGTGQDVQNPLRGVRRNRVVLRQQRR